MPGLVEGLIGACDGDEREVKVTFPPRSSVPQLANKEAIFKVMCKTVQRRELPEVPSEAFAEKVKSGMTWAELDGKLREGVEQDREERQNMNAHKALAKQLAKVLPEEFEVPETLVEQMTKERFAMMLGDMREQGTTDAKIKELLTPENYENYKKISRPMVEARIKSDFAVKTVGQQQGLVVSRDKVDEEIMTLQAQSLQRGEKFKESEVRPRVEQTLERNMVLNWLQTHATLNLVDPKEESVEEMLGASPEELAATMTGEGA
jgi:trigger factor